MKPKKEIVTLKNGTTFEFTPMILEQPKQEPSKLKWMMPKQSIKEPQYVIGIDTYDKYNLAYCLSRKVDGEITIILSKTMCDEHEFKQEVENLSKYFNAHIFSEWDK